MAQVTPTRWHALHAAQARDAQARVPFHIVDGERTLEVGSVARVHLPALERWSGELLLNDAGVTLLVDAAAREQFFDACNRELRAQGLIVAWRDETYPVLAQATRELLATFERAASRFWGTITFGAHCNGYVADANGRPTHLWIARRSHTKPTDPGLLDNMIGGGVPHGQSPAEAVLREGWEEAGLLPAQMSGLAAGSELRVARDIPEGFQLEWVSVYDLALPDAVVPANQDGEVAELMNLPVADALALAATDQMTVDAGLVTLDFALRHGLLPADTHGALQAALTPLRLGRAGPPAFNVFESSQQQR
jgi:8-oxo-dGTP pyrophosphatase MutT (NUDIX family)